MKILLVGSGGREHCIAVQLAKSSRLSKLYIAPGNAGTSDIGENVPIKDSEIEKLCQFALDNTVDLTIVGPEAPLVAGIVDLFEEKGLKIIGPSKTGALLEGSKEWAKNFMAKYNVPTASYRVFTEYADAERYLKEKNEYPIVIKADGLAAGKGVTVALSEAQALEAIKDCFINNVFREAGQKVVIEGFLKGEEASIFAFVDGNTILPMIPAQDHKAAYDGDEGPNTGGMGSYAPAPIATKQVQEKVYNQVFLPMLKGFQEENINYKGILYAGLMIDDGDVSIVEFNVRFGDPETQIVLPLLNTDLIDVFESMVNQTLDQVNLEWSDDYAVCVVIASDGYPGSYKKGVPITGTHFFDDRSDVALIHAGTKKESDQLLSNGGRVLGIVGVDSDLQAAIDKAYEGVGAIVMAGKMYRTDIGKKAF